MTKASRVALAALAVPPLAIILAVLGLNAIRVFGSWWSVHQAENDAAACPNSSVAEVRRWAESGATSRCIGRETGMPVGPYSYWLGGERVRAGYYDEKGTEVMTCAGESVGGTEGQRRCPPATVPPRRP
jgi:hypothetical protein